MSTSASQGSSSTNSERSVGTEWMLSNPVIDNPIYDFFEEEVPHQIPIFDTDDHTYTYLIHSSCLTTPINYSTLPEPSTEVHVAGQQVIVVETGEDVVEKILSFAKSGSNSVDIRSATGKLASVSLNRTSTPTETTTRHKGVFDIVSLSGSYKRDEVEGLRCWTGGLHLSSTADGIAFEGSVAGELIAESTVQVSVTTDS